MARTIDAYDAIVEQHGVVENVESRAWAEAAMRRFHVYLPGTRVLVPGCGDGRDSRYLASLGLDVTSFDLSSRMLELARRADAAGRYLAMDLRDMHSLLEMYEGIWANNCLYHLTKRELAEWLDRSRGRLGARGVLFLDLKEGEGERFEAAPSARLSGAASPAGARFYSYYTRGEILPLLSGFDILHHQRMDDRPGRRSHLQIFARIRR